jgi:hypothetical protein
MIESNLKFNIIVNEEVCNILDFITNFIKGHLENYRTNFHGVMDNSLLQDCSWEY